MDDKRTAFAIFLSILVILAYNQLFVDSQHPACPPCPTCQTCPPNTGTTISPQLDSGLDWDTTSRQHTSNVTQPPTIFKPTPQDYAAAPKLIIESNRMIVEINLLGGRVTSLKLRDYVETLGEPDLVERVKSIDNVYPLGLSSGSWTDTAVQYEIDHTSGPATIPNKFTVPTEGELSLTISGKSNDWTVKKTFIFSNDTYLFTLNAALLDAPADTPLWLEWTEYLNPEADSTRWNPKSFELLDIDQSMQWLPITKLTAEAPRELRATRWAGIGDNYFTTIMLPPGSGTNTAFVKQEPFYLIQAKSDEPTGSFELYTGPKDPASLEQAGHSLMQSVNLGWFAVIGQPILSALKLLYQLLGNYGLAIILLTILIKALLLPLTKTSFKSMRAMQELKPEMDALRERIKDSTQLNQEIMALYKKRGVNPMGGCLPMLLQIPVFFGMYNALRVSIQLRHAPFALWVNDLSAPENLEIFGLPVPVMIILMGLTMLASQLTMPTAMDPQQKKVMLLMPIIFTISFIIFPFPSGLVLYWLVSNLISILQQMALRGPSGIGPMKATLWGGTAIFAIGYIVTLI